MRDKRHITRRPVQACLLLAACLFCMTGCMNSLSDLDREVAELIERRQQMSLGEEGVNRVDVQSPNNPEGSANLYDQSPDTYNPAAADLPARRADPQGDAETTGADATPDAPVTLDLPDLLAYAIENAPEYRTQKERLFLATLSLIIERHEWGPRFFSTLSADVSGTPESGDYDTAMDLVNDFTVSQRLPYGGTASVSALVNYTNLLQQASTSTSADQTQSAAINASINLPLLRGSGMVAREDLIQAERDLIYAAREFERFRRSFFVDISNAYFGLLRQQRRIENQQLQINGLEQLAAQQRALAERGRIPEFEAADAETQVLFGRSNLASAQDDYASALDSLKLRIGMPVQQQVVIESADIQVPNPALNTAESIRIGLAARLDIQTTRDQVDDARRDVLVARDRLRGELDLDASFSLNSDGDRDIDGADFELADSDYRVGLEYSLPLDRRIEQAQYRSSLVDLERSERDYRTAQDRVALDIRDASRAIERATLTLELQSRSVELAERRLESVRYRRQRGEVPPRRLIEAEQDLLNARNGRDQARADLQTSVLNYLLQTGQMRVDPNGRWLAPGTLVDTLPQGPVPGDNEPGVGEDADDAQDDA